MRRYSAINHLCIHIVVLVLAYLQPEEWGVLVEVKTLEKIGREMD